MDDQNKKLSVIAYYLSKFDIDAIAALGYKNRTIALDDISAKVGTGNSYLKLRRDEFDVLTGSHRRGYANRLPSRAVLQLHDELKNIEFTDFTDIVSQLIEPPILPFTDNILKIDNSLSDLEIEAIINARDSSSGFSIKQAQQKARMYNPTIPENLKKLYQYRCQICECSGHEFGVHIVEAHHILPFSETQNNDSDNIIILCPNHHRLIHKTNAVFDRTREIYIFDNHTELRLKINLHL